MSIDQPVFSMVGANLDTNERLRLKLIVVPCPLVYRRACWGLLALINLTAVIEMLPFCKRCEQASNVAASLPPTAQKMPG